MPFAPFYDLNNPEVTQIMAKDIDDYFEENSFWASISGNDNKYPIYAIQQEYHGIVRHKFLGISLDDEDYKNSIYTTNYLSMEIMQDIIRKSVVSEDLRIGQDIHGNTFVREATKELSDWYRRIFDRKIFASLSHNCTNIAAFENGGQTGLYSIQPNQTTEDLCSQITAADTFNLKSLRRALYNARMGLDHTGSQHPKVRPYRLHLKNTESIVKFQNVLIAVLHPLQIIALNNDPNFINFQTYYPCISGQIGIVDGCIIVDGSEWDDMSKEAGILTSDVADISRQLNESEIRARGVTQMGVYAGANGQRTAVGLLLGGTSLLLCSKFKSEIQIEGADMKRKCKIGLDVFYGMRKTHYIGHTEKEKESFYHGKDFSCMALVSAI